MNFIPAPILSIVIPIFNSESSIERCVRSILIQPLSISCEVILVNDGSTDTSQDVIDKLAIEFPCQIKKISKTNKGPGDTRNAGILIACGDYIAFIDSDDSVEANYLSELFEIINGHQPDLILIDYHRNYTKKRNFFERLYKFKKSDYRDGLYKLRFNPNIMAHAEVASWLRIIKRELLQKNKAMYFSDNLKGPEDLEASMKWYLYVDTIYILNKKIYNYIIRPYSLNFKADSVLQFIKVQDNICRFYFEAGHFDEFEKELEYVCSKHLLLSNMLRLWASKQKGAYTTFQVLRREVLSRFERFDKNEYLSLEPLFVRIAFFFIKNTPWIFKLILK